MTTYGPFTAVAGTVQQCQIAPDAAAIYVINTSRFDLQIALQWGRPNAGSNFAGLPGTFTVSRGDRSGIPVPRENYGANGFPGWVWVLPIDNSGQLALTGNVSGSSLFTIQTYADASQVPPDYASPQTQDLSSQPRVVSIPLTSGANSLRTGAAAPVSASTCDLLSFAALGADGLFFSIFIAYFSLSLSADATTAGFLNAALQLDARNGANASLGGQYPITFARKWLSWPAAAGPMPEWEYDCPTYMSLLPGTAPVGIDHFTWMFKLFSNSASIPSLVTFTAIAYISINSANLNGALTPGIIGQPGSSVGLL